jgi:hypothetical protein
MHPRPMGSSQIASTCNHDIHYSTIHVYLIIFTPVTSQPMHTRLVGISQIDTTCPKNIHCPTMNMYLVTPSEEGPPQYCP